MSKTFTDEEAQTILDELIGYRSPCKLPMMKGPK